MGVLDALAKASAEHQQKFGYRLTMIRLPSCMFRALARELEPLIGDTGCSPLYLGGLSIHDTYDGS